jgi:hypothetical protein
VRVVRLGLSKVPVTIQLLGSWSLMGASNKAGWVYLRGKSFVVSGVNPMGKPEICPACGSRLSVRPYSWLWGVRLLMDCVMIAMISMLLVRTWELSRAFERQRVQLAVEHKKAARQP